MATKKRYIDEDGLAAFAVEVKVFVEREVANSSGGGGSGGGAVTSVNGKTGAVVINTTDIPDFEGVASNLLAQAQQYTGDYIGQQRQDSPINDSTTANNLVSVGALRTYVSTEIQEAITSALNTAV
jgi:hypothetical protein